MGSVTDIRFWIQGREYSAPAEWMAKQMEARKVLGMKTNEAALESMRLWAEQEARRVDQ